MTHNTNSDTNNSNTNNPNIVTLCSPYTPANCRIVARKMANLMGLDTISTGIVGFLVNTYNLRPDMFYQDWYLINNPNEFPKRKESRSCYGN